MINRIHLSPAELERFSCGPLGPHLGKFASFLSEQGYSRSAGLEKLRLVGCFSCWLEEKQIGIQELNEQLVCSFIKREKQSLRPYRQVGHTLDQLLEHLRRLKIIAQEQPPEPRSFIERLMCDYGRFLAQERGLSPVTLEHYLPVARRFLGEARADEAVDFERLSAAEVTGFILRERRIFSPKRMQLTTSALRSFLGCLHLKGQLAAPLAGAVPTVALWGQSDMPRFLEPEQVRGLLQSCQRSSPGGRRDYAVLLLLARLGLRAGEVVQLCLEDINWSCGELLIRGKSAREDRLPLLPDVGRALAAYLKKGRPACASRRVFIRLVAPRVGFSSSCAVSGIVRKALLQAELNPPRKGAHLLRHSLATQMLAAGASLSQIGQILRHQRSETTELYAKVDLEALRAVAQPWPGGLR